MAAGKYNIEIDQGSDFTVGLVLTENDIPKNLTGYTCRGQMRKKDSTATIAATFVCAITDAVNGILTFGLTNAVTKDLAAGTYFYDLELYTAADADVYRFLQGRALVDAEVTR